MRIEDSFAQNEVIFNNKFQSATNNKKVDEKSESIGFGDILKKCVDDVNGKFVEADSATSAFIRGDDVNIDEVMIKGQEASLSLQFLTVTRDKLLEGYNELSKMQL